MKTLACSASWGTPEFELRDADLKSEFREMVSNGELYDITERLLMVCIKFEIDLSSKMISDTRFLIAKIALGTPLTTAERTQLAEHWVPLHTTEFRLRAEEWVLVSDEHPVPYISGRWAPPEPNIPPAKIEESTPIKAADSKQGWLGPFGVKAWQAIWKSGPLRTRTRLKELAKKGKADKQSRESWLVLSSELSLTESDRLPRKKCGE